MEYALIIWTIVGVISNSTYVSKERLAANCCL